MKAIILAAGVGKRLRQITEKRPKCLIAVGGKTLIERALAALSRVGVAEASVVVGHLADQVRGRVGAACEGVRVRYIVNEAYRKGAILSLWCAREEFDDDLLIMDADVLFPVLMLRTLVRSAPPNCFLLDARAENTGEEQMLLARGGRVLGIVRGGRGDYETVGESVGFMKVCRRDAPALRGVLEDFVGRGQDMVEHEDAFNVFVRRCEVGYERVDGLPWVEIDSPQDLRTAETGVLARLEALDAQEAAG